MKKNSEYVGVDEKFIPEEEKYVDESLLGNKEEEKEKIKDFAKKSGNIAKKIGIGYLCFFGLIFVIVIGMIIFSFTQFFSTFRRVDKVKDNIGMVQQGLTDAAQQQMLESEKRSFNSYYEDRAGTERGHRVISVLETVVTNNKTNKEHIVTVSYNGKTASEEQGIVEIKYSFDKVTEYEVSLDYDEQGFVNKITITDIKK